MNWAIVAPSNLPPLALIEAPGHSWNVKLHRMLSLYEGPLWSLQPIQEYQMSKRKPAAASKHARSPKITAKAHRANQAVVRSPKVDRLRSVVADSNESPPNRHKDSKQEATLVENQATALQEDFKQTLRENDSKSGFDFSSATANVRAYQAKLLEMAQANIQLAFEFNQRLATIRSPFEILSVIAEFTGKRIAMFGKYSKEMAELSIKR
jgi:hypothetical protein